MLTFGYPWVLLILAAVPLTIFLRRHGWGRPAAMFYPETSALHKAFKGGRRPGSGIRELLRLAALTILILAAAQPGIIHQVRFQTASGLDIILALDISGSMAARDFEPLNRLQSAKAVLREILAKESRNRLGLIAFAARAYIVCPLTLDYQVLFTLLDHLEIGMTTDGTAIGMAIATGINRLKNSEARSKVIILLTDGRNNAGQVDPITAADMAAALDIRIYTIGMGRAQGAPIMVKDAVRGERAFLGPDGKVHIEAMDEETLKRIAKKTQGEYFRADDRKKLASIYSEIQELEQARLKSKVFKARRDIGPVFIWLAFLLFASELIMAQTLERRTP